MVVPLYCWVLMSFLCCYINLSLNFKALWRGHDSRKLHDTTKVISIRHRLQKINREAKEEDKLCHKTTTALSYLLGYQNYAHILTALKHLGEIFMYLFIYFSVQATVDTFCLKQRFQLRFEFSSKKPQPDFHPRAANILRTVERRTQSTP